MEIPIKNIYYLLCYAWNKLDEKNRVNVSIEDKTELLNLFAKVLINAAKILLKRGIDKNYNEETCEIAGIRGKLQIGETIKRNLLPQQRTVCTIDNFSDNIISNRILVSTIKRLINTSELDHQLKAELICLLRMLPGIDQIELRNSTFRKVRFHRNNKFYGFIINICQLIFEGTLPTEERGKYSFADFTRDDKKMNTLFEEFIRNFYKLEQNKFGSVKREIIKWQFDVPDSESSKYLPQMETDITLENKSEKIIIDAKYYRDIMALNYGNEKIKSGNLYQMFSYLLNQQAEDEKTMNTTGILLYPTNGKDYNLSFIYSKHKIQIKTVDLNTDWKSIHNRLLEIIQCPLS